MSDYIGMSIQIERGLKINTEEDVKGIKGYSEQQFAQFLLRIRKKNPDFEITYEPEMFERVTPDGKIEGTLPDFYVHNTRRAKSKGTYIEITISPKEKLIYLPANGDSGQETPSPNGTKTCKPINGNGAKSNGTGSTCECFDPKEKQKRVMREIAPDARYVVLYGENLLKIQKTVGGIDFFNGKIHTDEEKKQEEPAKPDITQLLPV